MFRLAATVLSITNWVVGVNLPQPDQRRWGALGRREDAEDPWLNAKWSSRSNPPSGPKGFILVIRRGSRSALTGECKEVGGKPSRQSNEPMLYDSPLQGFLPVEIFNGHVMRATEAQPQ